MKLGILLEVNPFQRIKFSIFLRIFLATFSLLGKEGWSSSCVRIFQQINREIQGGFVNPETKQRVAEYFSDATLHPKERARRAFVAVVSDRLSLLPKNEAKKVQEFLKKRVFRNYSDSAGSIRAYLHEPIFEKKIMLSLPELIQETTMEYGILIHELEHYIQNRAATRTIPLAYQNFFEKVDHFVDYTYEREVGAMIAEFEFMNTIPIEVRRATVQTISRNSGFFSKKTRDLLISLLDLYSQTPLEHVERQHLRGRYSRSAIEKLRDRLLRKQSLILLSAPSESLAVIAIRDQINELKEVCERLLQAPDLHPQSQQGKAGLFRVCEGVVHRTSSAPSAETE